MSNNKNHNKSITVALGAVTAAVAVPAMLFVGAGTAHAGGTVWNNADYLGTTVFIKSDGKTYGACTYNALPVAGVGIPPGPRPFILTKKGPPAQLWFPGVKLNTTWSVTVTCEIGDPIITTTVY
jgi:hypothetical protein